MNYFSLYSVCKDVTKRLPSESPLCPTSVPDSVCSFHQLLKDKDAVTYSSSWRRDSMILHVPKQTSVCIPYSGYRWLRVQLQEASLVKIAYHLVESQLLRIGPGLRVYLSKGLSITGSCSSSKLHSITQPSYRSYSNSYSGPVRLTNLFSVSIPLLTEGTRGTRNFQAAPWP